LELFNWVAEYYLCNIGEVLNVALPAGLKITSQSRIQLNPEFQYEDLLTEQEILVVEEIKKHQTLSYEEVERLLQKSNITSIIKSLVGKRAVILYEEVKERYKPKVARKIRLTSAYLTNDSLGKLATSLDKTPKQQEILLKYLSSFRFTTILI
jgi:primosomal protein N' (replication factor Y)